MRFIPLAMVGLVVATAASAQQPPPTTGTGPAATQPGIAPPPPPPGGLDADAPPPPPPGGPRGPRGDRPPPPPARGAAIHIERGVNGALRVDVNCSERDTTKDCADIMTQMLDRLNNAAKSK